MPLPIKEGIGKRELHFIWITDCSGSMMGAKIETLNRAIKEAIPHMQTEAKNNTHAKVLVRAIKFSSGSQWHISKPTPVEDFSWKDIKASGVTDMGKALSMLSEQLKIPPMPKKGLPPALVLVSDGYPTDDFQKGLNDLMNQNWGKKSVRLALAIGQDSKSQEAQDVFRKFIGNDEYPILQADNPDALVKFIKWASTTAIKTSSSPESQTPEKSKSKVIPLPPPPDVNKKTVW